MARRRRPSPQWQQLAQRRTADPSLASLPADGLRNRRVGGNARAAERDHDQGDQASLGRDRAFIWDPGGARVRSWIFRLAHSRSAEWRRRPRGKSTRSAASSTARAAASSARDCCSRSTAVAHFRPRLAGPRPCPRQTPRDVGGSPWARPRLRALTAGRNTPVAARDRGHDVKRGSDRSNRIAGRRQICPARFVPPPSAGAAPSVLPRR